MKSVICKISEVESSQRWDFASHDPVYTELIKNLDRYYPVIRFGDIITLLTDMGAFSLYKTEFFVEEGVPFLRVQNIQEYGVDMTKDIKYISFEYHNHLKKSQLQPNDLLLTTKAVIGIAAVVKETLGECNISQNLVRIRLKDGISPDYLAAFFNSKLGRIQTETAATGSNQKYLNFERIQDLKITLPPQDIQESIAQVMQNAHFAHQEKLLAAKILSTGIQEYILEVLGIKNILPKTENKFIIKQLQLNRFDVRYFLPFYTQLEQIIENTIYPTKTLSEICIKIVNGLTPAKDGYRENGCVVIKVASLTKDWRIEWNKVAFTSRTFFDKAKKAYIQDGDLLLLSASHQLDYIGGSFGLVRDIPIEYLDQCMAVGELIIVRVNNKIILPEYLLTCFIIKPIQELINRMSRGQTAHLYAEDLQYLRVPIPPMKIQQLIVDELNRRRDEAKRLHTEAENLLTESKARIERIILGEEEVT